MSSDESEWQDHLPLDDVPEGPVEASADAGEAFDAHPWGEDFADPFADPASTDLFSAEIQNVNASDWDVDSDLIWGDDPGDSSGLDLPF